MKQFQMVVRDLSRPFFVNPSRGSKLPWAVCMMLASGGHVQDTCHETREEAEASASERNAKSGVAA